MSAPITKDEKYNISINNLIQSSSTLVRLAIAMMDKLLGISKMNELYHEHQMQGLSKEEFADKLIDVLSINIEGIKELQAKIPASGPVVIASNHPFGGIEGVILARAIGQVRPDLKVLANRGLGIFKELQNYFIFTNPLSENNPKNGPSLRTCINHVKQGNALLLFPAGRVSYYQSQHKAIREHTWNKIVGRLVSIDDAQYVPVFVSGNNSKWFYRLGRVYFRLRMLMLARELLNKTNAKVQINCGNPVKGRLIIGQNYEEKSTLCRGLSYAFDSNWNYKWPTDRVTQLQDLISPVTPELIEREIAALPTNQRLVEQNEYSVYFGYQQQIPQVVKEIARLRELVFRQHNEGSGEPLDTDKFDATYTHLFIVKNNHQVIGAYRMGQTDILLKNEGLKGLYLNKMFNFSENFINRQEPCLEMGRSFLIPEFQGSYLGLLLLWRGIASFVAQHPRYRRLYGTVSISKLYNPKSVKLIESVMIKKENKKHVAPRNGFEFDIHPELNDLISHVDLSQNLNTFMNAIETDGKDIPILAKQYLKMGAKCHALGIDKSFNDTPGLLLSVHLPSAPPKQMKVYMGATAFEEYQQYQ